MVSKLPRWVWTGAWVLAFIAGMINVVGLLGFEHQAITHLTGTTSMVSAAIAEGSYASALHLAFVLGSFIAGTALSGFITKNSTLQLGSSYGVALSLESLFLLVAVPLLHRHHASGMYLASAACGLQNAMVSTYSGATVRTTHLSGMFTDLGIYLGHVLRGVAIDRKRLKLCAVIISGFFIGGIAGAMAFSTLSYSALYIPAGMTGLAAATYFICTNK
jgi:uncharacterized membrane protein YoaK (UPF0700 family)